MPIRISRRSVIGAAVPLAIGIEATASAQTAGAQTDATLLLERLRRRAIDFRTFEDFGAVGDFETGTGTGTDDTRAIQAAIDWAHGDGAHPGRAILMAPKTFLCGNITLYPTTTIIGTGKHSSAFWCTEAATGKWWSDHGRGAQKIMLSGIGFYAAGRPRLTHVIELGHDGVQFGTDGILYDLYVRDCPDGYGLELSSNVGNLDTITFWNCKYPLKVIGNANHLENIYIMEAGERARAPSQAVGADLAGCSVRGMHVEATASGALPLRLYGDCSVTDLCISSPRGARFSHLVEINDTAFDIWALRGVQLLGTGYTVANGMLKVGAGYFGGTHDNSFSGAHYLKSLDVQTGRLSLRGNVYQAFSVTIRNNGGVIEHRIGSLGDNAAQGNFVSRIAGAAPAFTRCPTGADASTGFAAGAKISSPAGNRVIFDTAGQVAADFTMRAGIQYADVGTPLTVCAVPFRGTVGGQALTRLALEFRDAANGDAFDLARGLAAGQSVSVWVEGYMA